MKTTANSPSFDDLRKDFTNVACLQFYDLSEGKIVVESSLPGEEIEHLLQKKFKDVKLIGFSSKYNSASCAVAIIGGKGTTGIIRLLDNHSDFQVEGTVIGLTKGTYTVSINEYGDISNGCSSTGNVLLKNNKKLGLLGKIQSNGLHDTQFALNSQDLCVTDCIGRSLVIQDEKSKIACGIIGRSSGINQNDKKICSCDGTIIWDEQSFGPYAVTPGVNK